MNYNVLHIKTANDPDYNQGDSQLKDLFGKFTSHEKFFLFLGSLQLKTTILSLTVICYYRDFYNND